MTRRLEPMERVCELGDASVPFPFDVHALIYSENAPELEKAFHDFLKEKQINLVNPRKEFFKADINELKAFIDSLQIDINLVELPEARQYRETESIRMAKTIKEEPVEAKYPDTLFQS